MEKDTAEYIHPEGVVEKNVLFGKDGWLFLYSGSERQFQYLSLDGLKPSPDSALNFEYNIRERAAACEAIGAKYIHVPMPSKPLCSEDKLPIQYRGSIGSLFDRFYEPALSEFVKSRIFYPLQAVKPMSLFRKLDTHMNEDGNYLVASLIMEKFGLSPVNKKNYKVTSMNMDGDLGVMLGKKIKSPEPHYECLGDPLVEFTNKNELPSNTNHIKVIHNPLDVSGRNLLVSGDSFALWLLRFLAPNFKNTVYVRGPEFPYEFLPMLKPTHVISSNAERYLARQSRDREKISPILQMLNLDGVTPNRPFMKALQALSARGYVPSHYEKWQEKTSKLIVSSNTLGTGRAEGMSIKEGSKDFTLNQDGDNSGYRFNAANFNNHKKYSVKISVHASKNATLQLFYTTWRPQEQSFQSDRMLTSNINAGYSVVKFDLPVILIARLLKIKVSPPDTDYYIEHAEAEEKVL